MTPWLSYAHYLAFNDTDHSLMPDCLYALVANNGDATHSIERAPH